MSTYESNLRSRFGGQLEDLGSIYLKSWHSISDVISRDGRRMFVLKGKHPDSFLPNTPVILAMDATRRLRISAMHTAIHLLCALARDEVVRGYAGPDISRVEFFGDPNDFNCRLGKIREAFFDCVDSRVPVNIIYASSSEISKYGKVEEVGDIDKLHDKVVRIVNIQGVDLRACNGTHAENTGELKSVEFGQAKICGDRRFSVRLKNCAVDIRG